MCVCACVRKREGEREIKSVCERESERKREGESEREGRMAGRMVISFKALVTRRST